MLSAPYVDDTEPEADMKELFFVALGIVASVIVAVLLFGVIALGLIAGATSLYDGRPTELGVLFLPTILILGIWLVSAIMYGDDGG
jgi:hypothetical protein